MIFVIIISFGILVFCHY